MKINKKMTVSKILVISFIRAIVFHFKLDFYVQNRFTDCVKHFHRHLFHKLLIQNYSAFNEMFKMSAINNLFIEIIEKYTGGGGGAKKWDK